MKAILTLAIALVLATCSCKTTKIVNGKVGCWYETEVKRDVCGIAEQYNYKDSTYTMRTGDGWAMKVEACDISWK